MQGCYSCGSPDNAGYRMGTMSEGEPFFLKTANYRVLIDRDGTGHIRIIRRVNFRTILKVFREVYLEQRKRPDLQPHITIYLSRSLSSEMSENLKDFLDFAVSCMDGTFELIIID